MSGILLTGSSGYSQPAGTIGWSATLGGSQLIQFPNSASSYTYTMPAVTGNVLLDTLNKLAASGGGVTTLAATASASNFTATFPAVTGNVNLDTNTKLAATGGGTTTLAATASASNYTITFQAVTGTVVIMASGSNAINSIAFNNSAPILGDEWFDSITQEFAVNIGASGQGMTAYVPAILYALKVPAAVTAGKNGVYSTCLNTAGQTYNGTNTLKANFLTVGKHIHIKAAGVLTITGSNSTASAKIQIGGVDVCYGTSGTITIGSNIPWSVEAFLQCQVAGGGANSTINGWIRFEVSGYTPGQFYVQLTNVNITSSLVVDLLLSTAANQSNTFTPYMITITSEG